MTIFSTKFKCKKCGTCCRNIGLAIKLALDKSEFERTLIDSEFIKFPYSYDIAGECEMLINNKCLVYEHRPTICNVEKMWSIYFQGIWTKKDFFKFNKAACKRINIKR